MIFKVLILAVLLKVLDKTSKPLLCAVIYAAAVCLLMFLYGFPFEHSAFAGAVSLVLSSLYFSILHRVGYGAPYWLLALSGGFFLLSV